MPYIERLKSLKEKSHLTNQEIARLSNVPLATITRIFNGSTPNPTFETLAGIAMALGVTLDEVAGLKSKCEEPIAQPVAMTLSSYAELLAEKDARIKEKDETISSLKADIAKERKEKHALNIALFCLLAIAVVVILVDIFNGNFGYLRY